MVAELSDEAVKHFQASGAEVMVDIPVYAAATASWGIDRIDQPNLPLDSEYDTNNYGSADTHIYIIDTGLNEAHVEFAGRVGQGYDVIDDDDDPSNDCNGHGTHCAGSAAGATVGVAKHAIIHGVRALICDEEDRASGAFSDVLAGLEWVLSRTDEQKKVVSLSLSGQRSDSINTLMQKYIDAGLPLVVAAGNNGADACDYSPASAVNVITVGATTEADEGAAYSNSGECVSIFAPGSRIRSAWIGASDAYNTISGTSMATPHVAGVVAQILAASTNTTLTPAEVWQFMEGEAVKGKLKDSTDPIALPDRHLPNVLLQVVRTLLPSPPPSPPKSPPPPAPPPAPPSPPSPPPAPSVTLRIEIDVDGAPEETRWYLFRVVDGTLKRIATDSPTLAEFVWVEEVTAGSYRWQITDSIGNGICCVLGNGEYRLFLDGKLIASGGAFGVSKTHDFDWGVASPPPPNAPPSPPSPSPPPPPSKLRRAAEDVAGKAKDFFARLLARDLTLIEWLITGAVVVSIICLFVVAFAWCYLRKRRLLAELAASSSGAVDEPPRRGTSTRARANDVTADFASVSAGNSRDVTICVQVPAAAGCVSSTSSSPQPKARAPAHKSQALQPSAPPLPASQRDAPPAYSLNAEPWPREAALATMERAVPVRPAAGAEAAAAARRREGVSRGERAARRRELASLQPAAGEGAPRAPRAADAGGVAQLPPQQHGESFRSDADHDRSADSENRASSRSNCPSTVAARSGRPSSVVSQPVRSGRPSSVLSERRSDWSERRSAADDGNRTDEGEDDDSDDSVGVTARR